MGKEVDELPSVFDDDTADISAETDKMLGILKLCLTLDELSLAFYKRLSETPGDIELAAFWRTLAIHKTRQIRFWKHSVEIACKVRLPKLFHDPDGLLKELRRALAHGRQLTEKCGDEYNVKDCFTASYRLEFCFLHPAIIHLFGYLGDSAGVSDIEEKYDGHLETYVRGLARFGEVTPEMELLGETITNLWSRNRLLSRQASHDPLTGLMNRRSFFLFAVQVAHLAARSACNIAVMMADIDCFKGVNDAWGHAMGDKVLQMVADVISRTTRKSDLAARYGGDEFVVLLSNTTRREAVKAGRRLLAEVREILVQGAQVTASIGISDFLPGRDPAASLEEGLLEADRALYRAKKDGRNMVIISGDAEQEAGVSSAGSS